MRITLLSAALLASGVAMSATPIDGWYTSVFGGYTYLPKNINNLTLGFLIDEARFKEGYNAGGRIGYQSHPIRYELEYTYIWASLRHFDINNIRQGDVRGTSSGNLLMANIYVDFPEMLPAISPFLGIGLGYAFVQETLATDFTLAPVYFPPVYFHGEQNSFAYQGTAGITYNFSENYAVNLAYRYAATTKDDDFGKVYQAHMANIGVIYHFDYGNYK